METLTIGQTYGRALFEAAADLGKTAEIGAELKAVNLVFEAEPMLKKLLLLPTISATEKKDAAEKVFEGRVSRELLNFMRILIDKSRMGSWERIGRQYEKLASERDGVTHGILYTVAPVDAGRLKSLEEKTSATLGKAVGLENRTDKTIIGGAKIYVDGKLIDVSVKTRLESMKQRIRA
ncbi:MAG: ATP synthase F1 subunit delta [Clostridiales bacterium]|nr:ATP synthase F1 subunit delta [Clostridiales bacterium]